MTRTLSCLIFCCFPLLLSAQKTGPTPVPHSFSADTIQQLITDTYKELALKHPGFYRYTPKPAFDHFTDSLKATVHDSLTELDVYRKLKPLISKIGCLHTDISLPASTLQTLNASANLLPLQVYAYNNRLFVVKNLSGNQAIRPGSEIVRINGKPVAVIIRQLFASLVSDGYNETMKYRALYHLFPTLYRNLIESVAQFDVEVLQDGKASTHTIPAGRFEALAADGFLKEYDVTRQLEFAVKDSIGLMTIHSFAASDIKKGGQQFERFVKESFGLLKEKKINRLIVDLRYNTGGSDKNAALFSSYFFDQPYRYWDRIEVTEAVAKDIKGSVRLFYRQPVYKDSVWLWQKGKTVRDFDFYEVQQPAKDHFTGKVLVLINGFCMSSCADVTAVLSHNKKAIFIGEETGGGYQGNNSGLMPTTVLAPTGIPLTVPLQKYVNAVQPDVQVGSGTIPDHPVMPTVQDVIDGKDVVMATALQLITSMHSTASATISSQPVVHRPAPGTP